MRGPRPLQPGHRGRARHGRADRANARLEHPRQARARPAGRRPPCSPSSTISIRRRDRRRAARRAAHRVHPRDAPDRRDVDGPAGRPGRFVPDDRASTCPRTGCARRRRSPWTVPRTRSPRRSARRPAGGRSWSGCRSAGTSRWPSPRASPGSSAVSCCRARPRSRSASGWSPTSRWREVMADVDLGRLDRINAWFFRARFPAEHRRTDRRRRVLVARWRGRAPGRRRRAVPAAPGRLPGPVADPQRRVRPAVPAVRALVRGGRAGRPARPAGRGHAPRQPGPAGGVQPGRPAFRGVAAGLIPGPCGVSPCSDMHPGSSNPASTRSARVPGSRPNSAERPRWLEIRI